MKNAGITIEILSYWHAGSGKGRGGDVDSLVVRDRAGLPFIPGKTLKGLFREAVTVREKFEAIPPGTTDRLFGKAAARGEYTGSEPGALFFQSAGLDEGTADWLKRPDCGEYRAALFAQLASTQLDENGQADDRTLRRIEVVIPVTLGSKISGPDDGEWISVIAESAPLIRSLGSHRHRGLGRSRISVARGKEER